MPRIRSIKPDFFVSEDVSALPLRARLTWIGLWTHCDDHGRTKDVARLVKAAIWPLDDVTIRDVEEDLTILAGHGRIVRYVVDDRAYLAVVNWHVHQAVNRPRPSSLPLPPVPVGPSDPTAPGYCRDCHVVITDDSVSPHGDLTPGREGKGKEGRGNARAPETEPSLSPGPTSEPPLRCPKHTHDPDPPPCRPCGDARRAHDSWKHQQTHRPTPVPERPHCPLHPDQPTGSQQCPTCAAEAAPAPDLRAALRRTPKEIPA